LLAHLANASDNDVIDGARIDAIACDNLPEKIGEQIDGMDLGQGASRFAATHRGSDRIDNDWSGVPIGASSRR
jgi:hypothetical protein